MVNPANGNLAVNQSQQLWGATPAGLKVPMDKTTRRCNINKTLGAVAGGIAGAALGLTSTPFNQFTGGLLGIIGGANAGFKTSKTISQWALGKYLESNHSGSMLVTLIGAAVSSCIIIPATAAGAIAGMWIGIMGGTYGSVIAGALGGAVIGEQVAGMKFEKNKLGV